MSKASILRQLKDEDLEAIHHLIRRDASGDLEIARQAEAMGKLSLGPTDAAKAMVIARYRKGPEFGRWLTAWENRESDLREAIATQQQRLEVISNLVRNSESAGLEQVSKHLQARLLALAAEADDETLKDAASGGWVSEILKLAQADIRDQYRKKVEELKAQIEQVMNAPKGKTVRTEDLVATVDAVMGIKR